MATTSTTHPRLASDVVRSYLSIGIGWVLVIGTALALVFIAPPLLSGMAYDEFARLLFYALWASFCIIYIALSLSAFLRLSSDDLQSAATATDPGPSRSRRLWWALNGGGAIWWALTGAAVTLYSLVDLIVTRVPLTPALLFACIAVVVVTAGLIIVAFAVNYAREDAVRGGFEFPGTPDPRFEDYLYLSIQLSTTIASSDVQVRRRGMRRIVSMHSLIAFTFNTVIVALLVSVLVGRLA